jgi:hypothetical protein
MNRSFFTALVILACCNLSAQDSTGTPRKPVPTSASVKLTNGALAKGWLYSMNDSQIVLLRATPGEVKRFANTPGKWDGRLTTVAAGQIENIATRKRNSVVKGCLIGLAVGVFTGAVGGFISGDDRLEEYPSAANDPYGLGALGTSLHNSFAMTAGEKALVAGAGLGVTGAIIGTIIGAVAKKKFIIGGKKEKYRDLAGDLNRRLLVR